MNHSDDIITGCAEILWANAWGSHVEEVNCTRLSGLDTVEHMPEMGLDVFVEAGKIIGAVEHASEMDVHAILWKCLRASGIDPEDGAAKEHMVRFGNCLAYMATGDGVSWFDDYTECDALKIPDLCVNLQAEAGEACEYCRDAPVIKNSTV